MKKVIIGLFLLITIYNLSSCTVFRRLYRPSDFTYLYDGKYTRLDTLINIDGYYKSIERQTEYGNKYHTALMFYRDGLVCFTLSDDPRKPFRDKIYSVNSWGTYKVYKDTIKCQSIGDGGVMGGISVSDKDYYIVSKNEIVLINTDTSNEIIPHFFYPLENRIDSTEWNWLLKKKWFWDKKTWKNRKKE